jgi:hypothetical protein
MEDKTKPVLAPIATGPIRQHDLRPDEQAIIATWAMKTAMHAVIAAPVDVIPRAEYRRFPNAGRPADATLVMMALYGGRRVVCRANLALGEPQETKVGRVDSYAATLQAGRAVFFVVDYFGDSPEVQIDMQDVSAFATRIWPPNGRTVRMAQTGSTSVTGTSTVDSGTSASPPSRGDHHTPLRTHAPTCGSELPW